MLEKPRLRFKTGLNARLVLAWTFVVPVFYLIAISAAAQSNVVVRVMASNLTGDPQTYQTPQLNILKGLKADVVAMQEFHYTSPTYGTDTPNAFREMIDATFGTNYVYFRESGYSLPNGIISRYPIIASGSFDDTEVSNRGFAWAQIDLPGTNDLYIVSVHLLTTSSSARGTEATNLKALIQANFPANAWIIVAGDMNTDSRSEAAISTFTTFLSDSPIPTDAESGGTFTTNLSRKKPYDYVLPSFAMTNTLTPVVFTSHTFPNGLVFDSRVYDPLTDVPPVQASDSSNCQHMGIVKDFLVPTLQAGALLSVSPAGGFSSSGQAGGPFTPSSQNYTVSNSGDSNVNWGATYSASWVTVSPTNGTLIPGTSTNVAVSINATANSLAVNSYSDTVVFTNKTNGAGSATRSVNLIVTATSPVIVTNGYTLSAENCTPGNGIVDPGETVTVNLSLKNTGSANATNLVATLLATGEVISPDGPFTYGVVSNNGTPVTQAFTFTAGGACGGVITAMLQLQDGPANLGTISYTIPLGVTTAPLTQNFDSVTAPALPAGWATSASGAQSNWVTSTTSADTAPNAAFSPAVTNAGVNELDSPAVAINSTAARLTFRQNYNLAASASNSSIGYDGGVLEIKIGSGSYTDIVASGGSFVTGGYNRTLSGDFSNPLASRSAWSGNSGGFTTTVVNLPATAAGQNVQLRWRCGAGNTPAPVTTSGTLAFWNFDASTATPNTVGTGLAVTPVTLTNATGSVTFPAGNPGQAMSGSGFTATGGAPATSYSCYTFSITPTNGSLVDLSSISFDDQRSGTGPTNFTVQISQQANFSSTNFNSGVQVSHTNITFNAGNAFILANSNLTGTIYFRVYANGTGNSASTWRFDNVKVQGSVTAGDSTGGTGWYVDSVSIQDAFCCTNFASAPVADFSGSPTNGPAPLNVNFIDSSTGAPTDWAWDFGDAGNSTSQNPLHAYAAGTWSVTLIASNASGSSTITKTSYITAWTPFQAWQVQYFTSIDNPNAAGNVDADGDGQNNLAEFMAGTDPTNSVSALRITSIAREGIDVRITWTMGSGKTNALQVTSGSGNGSFATNTFANLFIVTNTVGTVTNRVDTGGATNIPARYYRVRLVP